MKVSLDEAERLAQEVIDRCQSVSVRTAGLHFESSVPSSLNVAMRASTNLSVAAAFRGNVLVATSTYSVQAGPIEEVQAGMDVWSTECILHGQWTLSDGAGFTAEHAQAFALAVSATTLHPYARAQIQAVVTAAGLVPFTLDVMPSLLRGDEEGLVDLDLITHMELESEN